MIRIKFQKCPARPGTFFVRSIDKKEELWYNRNIYDCFEPSDAAKKI